MTIITIRTGQAPDAKPERKGLILTDEWQTMIEVPQYQIPEETFGSTEVVVPGVAEVISPLLICNVSSGTATVTVKAVRYEDANTSSEFILANEIPVSPNDLVNLPLNGQFFLSGDKLEVKSDTIGALHVTISYTVGQAEQDDVDGEVEII
jgi:hypothetical protein